MAKNNKNKPAENSPEKKKQQNAALKNFQNQEHNTQKEALGPNTKR